MGCMFDRRRIHLRVGVPMKKFQFLIPLKTESLHKLDVICTRSMNAPINEDEEIVWSIHYHRNRGTNSGEVQINIEGIVSGFIDLSPVNAAGCIYREVFVDIHTSPSVSPELVMDYPRKLSMLSFLTVVALFFLARADLITRHALRTPHTIPPITNATATKAGGPNHVSDMHIAASSVGTFFVVEKSGTRNMQYEGGTIASTRSKS